PPEPEPAETGEARKLFQANLDAIRRRDRAAYLACYLDSETLARTGPGGIALGFGDLVKSAGENWPDTFDASDLQLVPVRPGFVYGTYRYRVRYGAEEQAGLSERLFVSTPKGWKIAMTSAFQAPPGTPPPPRALVGGTLVDGTGAPPVPGATVVIRAGKIVCAGKNCDVPAGVTVVDTRGSWITPGLVDAHVHFSQTGWADGRPDAFDVRDRYPYEKVVAGLAANPERWFRSQLCSGTTAVFDVGGYAWTIDLEEKAGEDSRAPHVAAAGPLLSTLDFWLNLPAERQFMFLENPDSARAGVRYLKERGADAVKVWYIVTPQRAVEDSAPSVLAAGEAAKAQGLPLIVHATGLAEAKVALRAGAKLLVHGVSDQPVDEEFIRLARAAGTIYCPTLSVLSGYLRLAEAVRDRKAPTLDDPNGCVDAATRAKLEETARLAAPENAAANIERQRARLENVERFGSANLKALAAAGIPIAMGTDAGNPLTLHGPSVYAEMEAMQGAGMTPMQVLVASTRGGSRAMGREKEIGTIEKDKVADLLVVAGDPTVDIAHLRQVRYVVRGGVVRSIEELRAVVAAAK
ncbi:MAG: amidohydrolase family protein, partial [Thermoanaerobaculia bacterium]|nr:amidohydrolase family protein [Thermoanaerobaculia bacterium]